MKSWVDNRGYAGNVLHELVQCNFLQWMECLFYDSRFILRPRSHFTFDKNKHFRRRTTLFSKKSIFMKLHVFPPFSNLLKLDATRSSIPISVLCCSNFLVMLLQVTHTMHSCSHTGRLVARNCMNAAVHCVTSCSVVYYSACINIWFCLLKWQIALFMPYINMCKHCSVNKASWVVSNRDWLGKNPYIMGFKKR